jgi:hypothetical protein
MEFNHPEEGAVFVLEDDERINIQATVGDNISMDRVQFFVDGENVITSTVQPYNKSWTIAMSDTVPKLGPAPVGVILPFTQTDGTVVQKFYLATTITATRAITNPDGTVEEESYAASQVLYDPELDQLSQWFDGGMGIISDTNGYTETHLIHVVAYDAAGNKVESEPVRVYVIHKQESDKESAVPHGAIILPVRWRDKYIDVERSTCYTLPQPGNKHGGNVIERTRLSAYEDG